MKKSKKFVNDFNIMVARNIVHNANILYGNIGEKWQTAWVQKNTYKKFRRADGTFDKKENWQLI